MSNIKNHIKDNSKEIEDFIKELDKIGKKSKKVKKQMKQINEIIKDTFKNDDCEKISKEREEQFDLVKKFNVSLSKINLEASEMLSEVIKHRNINILIKKG